MSNPLEMLEVIDENDNVVGLENRAKIHQDGLLHREIHIWFLTPKSEIVFQHRAKNKDTYPDKLDATVGGHVGPKMSYEETVVKECKEETGIEDIEFADGFREVMNYFYKRGEETMHKEVVFFLAKSAAEEVTISKEHIGYAWLGYENAFKKLTFNNAKELLRKADKFIKEH